MSTSLGARVIAIWRATHSAPNRGRLPGCFGSDESYAEEATRQLCIDKPLLYDKYLTVILTLFSTQALHIYFTAHTSGMDSMLAVKTQRSAKTNSVSAQMFWRARERTTGRVMISTRPFHRR
ncbi:hypothetical protein BST16_15280 [Mycobacterium asiaticum DSM 44297]|nr:hypothetical protein BST16_15280 [Mycobacterium asiaticum DSM 44297]